MIDKIIKLQGGKEYYILDAFRKEGRIFIFGLEANNEKEILTNVAVVCEIQNNNGTFKLVDLEPEELREVNKVFIQRIKDSKGIEL